MIDSTAGHLATTLPPMSDTITPNVPYLRKVVEWVEAEAKRTEDREWYQATWLVPGKEAATDFSQQVDFCDTACCVAGKVALLEGWTPETYHDNISEGSRFTSNVLKGGEKRHVGHVASDALGLTDSEADRLFMASNTVEDIRAIAEEIAGERL